VEIDAENDENRECCRREADFELRMRRQTEHVHIPPAPFKPVVLLIDSRVPRKLKLYLTENLVGYDFVVCTTDQSDENLVLEMQGIIDSKRHVLLYANRGAHSLARLNFVSGFNSVVSALIPSPHIVALDCTLVLRVQDWYTMFSVEQSGMTHFNVGESASCDLSLGKIRRLCGVFRECLVYDSADQLDSESDSEDEVHHTNTNTNANNGSKEGYSGMDTTSARQPQHTPLATIAEEDAHTEFHEHARKSSMLTVHTTHTAHTHNTSHTHNTTHTSPTNYTNTSTNSAYKRRVRLDVVEVPQFVRTLFMADFNDFMLQIAQKLITITPKTVVSITTRASIVTDLHMQFTSTEPVVVQSSVYLYSDYVLAATIATILNLWKAPLTEWTPRDICKGCHYFRKYCAKLTYNQLCEVLEQREFVDSGVIACKRLERAMQLTDAWCVLNKHDFYTNPARSILSKWAAEMVELMNRCVSFAVVC